MIRVVELWVSLENLKSATGVRYVRVGYLATIVDLLLTLALRKTLVSGVSPFVG